VLLGGQNGLFSRLPAITIGVLNNVILVSGIYAYFRIASLRSYLREIDMTWLTCIQLWRIPAAYMFWHIHAAHGKLPPILVQNAATGDWIGGLLVPLVFIIPSQWRYKWLLFHIYGIADFVVALGTGAIGALTNAPRVSDITELPTVFILLFAVPILAFAHIIAIDKLIGSGRGSPIHNVNHSE